MELRYSNFQLEYNKHDIVVHPLGLHLKKGDRIGIIGESGAGKSTLVKGLFGNISGNFYHSGNVDVEGKVRDISNCRSLFHRWWGRKVSFVFQEPVSSLAEQYTIRQQLQHVLEYKGTSSEKMKEQVQYYLQLACFPLERQNAYAKELSGGENQRACIALAMAAQPEILIADEPTTSLDLIKQKKIIETLKNILKQYPDLILIFVTHSLEILQELFEDNGWIYIFYRGFLFEKFHLSQIQKKVHHPYTRQLFYNFLNDYRPITLHFSFQESMPAVEQSKLIEPCPYLSQCSLYAFMQKEKIRTSCSVQKPKLVKFGEQQEVACHFLPFFETMKENACVLPFVLEMPQKNQVLLQVNDLSVGYEQNPNVLKVSDYTIYHKQHVGILGETGSGKTTLAKVFSLLNPYGIEKSGKIWRYFEGKLQEEDCIEMPQHYHNLNILTWQHPWEVFPPNETMETILKDACQIWARLWNKKENRKEQKERIQYVLNQLGFEKNFSLQVSPQNYSGGQRKRLLLARSFLACGYPNEEDKKIPRILYLDEPLSGIDAVNKSKVLHCIQNAGKVLNATLVVITHDPRVAYYLCQEFIFMKQGEIIEAGSREKILSYSSTLNPHPYVIELLQATPSLNGFHSSFFS
ncbi:MAG TPA: ATP-binding cassette domain-containing protein [Planctomycetota bacterium]|nr:ATP-binding cassette domain-containing protein [Planctomycetota bacterium]